MGSGDATDYLHQLEASERLQGADLVKGNRFKPLLIFKWADELVRHPVILEAVEDLIGPNIRVLLTTVFPKPPHDGTYVGWDQGGTYFALDPDDLQVAVWMALSDASIKAGGIEIIVGSHRKGQLHHDERPQEKHLLSLGQTIAAEHQAGATEFMLLAAGQTSLHHTHSIHRSGPNTEDYRRVGVTLTYVPAHVRVRGGVRPTGALVCGEDPWGNFEDEPRPFVEYGEQKRA